MSIIDCCFSSTCTSSFNSGYNLHIDCTLFSSAGISGNTSDDTFYISIFSSSCTNSCCCSTVCPCNSCSNCETKLTQINCRETNRLICYVINKTYLKIICPCTRIFSSPSPCTCYICVTSLIVILVFNLDITCRSNTNSSNWSTCVCIIKSCTVCSCNF